MQRPPIAQQVTFLYTNDTARSFAFYEDVVGLQLVLDQGSARIYRTGGDAYLGICETSRRAAGPGRRPQARRRDLHVRLPHARPKSTCGTPISPSAASPSRRRRR